MARNKIKLSKDNQKNLWILGWITIGLILGGIIGGIALTTIGEQEFQTSIVGMKIGRTTEYQGAFEYDYIDYELDSDRTQDYSTWHPDYHFSNYATRTMDKYSWNIDPDTSVYGSPNVMASIPGEYYPSDQDGNQVPDFVITPVPMTFYDPSGYDWTAIFYRTIIATQLTITVAGGKDIDPYSYLGEDYIDSGAKAETPTTYNCLHGTIEDNSFVGNGVEFRIVLRNQIKEFKVGEDTHSDPFDTSDNAFLWAKLGSVTTNIQSSAGWQYLGDYTGDLISHQLVMYPTNKDALIGTNQLSNTEINQIELGDTLYDTVYTALEYEVKLGANWNTWGTSQWALYNQDENGLQIQGWQILANVVFCITTGFLAVDWAGHSQAIVITNPFEDPDIIDNTFNLLDFLRDAWQTPWGRGLIIAGIVIVCCIFGFLFIRYLLPFLMQIVKARRAMGSG